MRLGLYLLGGLPDQILLEDARDLLVMGVRMGRVPPASRWVDEFRRIKEMESFQGLLT